MFGSIAQEFLPATPYDPVGKNSGIDGFLYNPQILASLRQDNIDTAAAVGSPVGMVFDQWVTNTLGSDLVTNGDFPTVTTGWTAASSSLSIVSAALRVTNTGAAVGRAWQSLTTVVGETYKCTLDLVANADGARICVGTNNGSTQLADLAIAAGVTGSYTFYFTATTTTSFIQLRTNVATSTKFTDWDNVTAKSIAGRHLIQLTPANRPTLRQASNGTYYLECAASQGLAGAPTYTVQTDHYLAVVGQWVAANQGMFMVGTAAGTGHQIRHPNSGTTTPRALAGEVGLGLTTVTGLTLTYPAGRVAVIDTLLLNSVLDVTINRRPPITTAQSWVGGTTVPNSAPSINCFGTVPTNSPNHFYGGVGMKVDPGADRAGIRSWLANLALAD